MIRVAIIAQSLPLGEQLAAELAESDRLRIVGTYDSLQTPRDDRPNPADVWIAVGFCAKLLPKQTPPVVFLNDDPPPPVANWGAIRAWLPRAISGDALLAAIDAVHTGLVVLNANHSVSLSSTSARRQEDFPLYEHLTAREMEVLGMLAAGLANKEIAARLGISDHTVKFHVAQILAKLSASSRTEAVAIALRRGLILI